MNIQIRRTRKNDWETSIEGAISVAYRAGTQKARLMAQYEVAGMRGLTDEEAAKAAGLDRTCYWKRCGELREDGQIVVVMIGDSPRTRTGDAGVQRIVCRIP